MTPAAVRMRVKRGKIKGFHKDGRLLVVLDTAGEQRPKQRANNQAERLLGLPAPSQAELDRLIADNATLNRRLDDVLKLLEREQVLRQQMQGQLTALTDRLALPPPEPGPDPKLQERLASAEQDMSLLKRGVVALIQFVEKTRK